jgi:hypothetical protein
VTPRQIHSDIIHCVSEPPREPLAGDGLVTSTAGILLGISGCRLPAGNPRRHKAPRRGRVPCRLERHSETGDFSRIFQQMCNRPNTTRPPSWRCTTPTQTLPEPESNQWQCNLQHHSRDSVRLSCAALRWRCESAPSRAVFRPRKNLRLSPKTSVCGQRNPSYSDHAVSTVCRGKRRRVFGQHQRAARFTTASMHYERAPC